MNFSVLAVNEITASVHLLQTATLNNPRYCNSQRAAVSIQCYHSCVMSAASFQCKVYAFVLLFQQVM